ncbi:MAG: V4R domain-containing protein [Candidatus Micrarchaeales archaeon]
MGLLDKLMMARLITFKDGSISLYNNRVVMAPATFFYDLTQAADDNPNEISHLYESAKNSFKDIMAKDIRSYKFSVNDYIKWLFDTATFAGWGMLSLESLDKDKMTGTITMINSPMVEGLKGKAKTPVDHIVRGFIAGAVSMAFKGDLDAIEIECEALGAVKCKFLFKPAAQFEANELAAMQLKK